MRATLAALCLSALAVAQTPPCIAFNDATPTVDTNTITSFGFAGQNSNAWQFTPANTSVLLAAQCFTRNSALTGDRYMMLEIWSDNAGVPGTRLGGGAWRIVNSRPYGWQGANFDHVVVVNSGTPYWVVWIDPGFSTIPREPGGPVPLPVARRTGAGAWNTTIAAEAAKIRLFCNQLDDAHTAPYGQFCFASNGLLPSVHANEQPNLGNAGFFFETNGATPGTPVFLVLGLDATFLPVATGFLPPGCFQNTDILTVLLLSAGTGNSRGPTCAGYVSSPLAIPSDPNLTGLMLAAQSVPFDAGATSPVPFVSSAALRVTLF